MSKYDKIIKADNSNLDYKEQISQMKKDESDRIKPILHDLFSKLDKYGYLQEVPREKLQNELDQYDQCRIRANRSYDLLHRMVQDQKNNIPILAPHFSLDDAALITTNMIVFCLLDRYEVIPQLFKTVATKEFLIWYNKNEYERTNDCIFTLGGLFYKFGDKKLDCKGIKKILNTELRNAIAHGQYWWEPVKNVHTMMFFENGIKRIISKNELIQEFNRVSIIPNVIMNEFISRGYVNTDLIY